MSPQRCVCGRTTGGDGGSVNELAATGAYSHVNHTSRSALTDKKCRTSRVKQVCYEISTIYIKPVGFLILVPVLQ